MHFENTTDHQATPWRDVPYSYATGFYEMDIRSHTPPALDTPSQGNNTYDFSSDLIGGHRFRHGPTVEQVIAQGYFAAPRGRPETSIITDKEHTSWLGLDNIIQDIRQRYEICERNLYEIELAKCDALSAFYSREATVGFVPANGKEFYSLNKNLQGLYQQQREERTSLWQDVSRLKQTLPETAQQYLSNYRKVSLLTDGKGDDL